MIAHSLRGEVFGPSQRLHGATYVVDATFRAETVDADGIVVDIGLVSRQLREVLDTLDRRNLDEEPPFNEQNSTTELVARHIANELAARAAAGALGPPAQHLTALAITLHESPVAWATYERTLG